MPSDHEIPRKIVAIAAASDAGVGYEPHRALYALADDGTLWEYTAMSARGSHWDEVMTLPPRTEENADVPL